MLPEDIVSVNNSQAAQNSDSNSSPQPVVFSSQGNSSPTSSNKTLVIILLVAVFFLLAIMVGGALYFMTSTKKLTVQPASTQTFTQTTSKERNGQILTPTSPPPVESSIPIQTVQTEFKGVSAILTGIRRSGKVVTVSFKMKASSNPGELASEQWGACNGKHDKLYSFTMITLKPHFTDNEREDCMIARIENDTPYSLTGSYIVDEVNQMKYEVLKDANGKLLYSEDTTVLLYADQELSLYAQFTAPPETAKTVTINFPKIQPFVGVELQ